MNVQDLLCHKFNFTSRSVHGRLRGQRLLQRRDSVSSCLPKGEEQFSGFKGIEYGLRLLNHNLEY